MTKNIASEHFFRLIMTPFCTVQKYIFVHLLVRIRSNVLVTIFFSLVFSAQKKLATLVEVTDSTYTLAYYGRKEFYGPPQLTFHCSVCQGKLFENIFMTSMNPGACTIKALRI